MRTFRRADWLALVFGVVVAVAAGEGLLRLFWPQRSDVTLGMFRADPWAGYSLRPEYRNEVRLPEYRTRIHVDGDGYRVPDDSPDATPGAPSGGPPVCGKDCRWAPPGTNSIRHWETSNRSPTLVESTNASRRAFSAAPIRTSLKP